MVSKQKFMSHAEDNLFLYDYKQVIDDAMKLPTSVGNTSVINPRAMVLHQILSDAREDTDVSNDTLEKIVKYKIEQEIVEGG